MKSFLGSRVLPHFVYYRPKSIGQLLDLLYATQGEYKFVAGCTDFIPAIRRGTVCFEHGLKVIDLKSLKEITDIKADNELLTIGAGTRLSEIARSELVKQYAHVLAEAAGNVGSSQIRNAATIGGNLCNASPAADTAPPLLALNARVKMISTKTERHLPLDEFFTGPGQTALGRKEILTEIQLPKTNTTEKSFWIKAGRRTSFTLSVVSVATWLRIRDGLVEDVRIALGAVAPTPMRARQAEQSLKGKALDQKNINEAARIVGSEIKPINDVRASAQYRRDMAIVLAKRALLACA
jgi:carbon-monoxide dehydrogenase medium subunit